MLQSSHEQSCLVDGGPPTAVGTPLVVDQPVDHPIAMMMTTAVGPRLVHQCSIKGLGVVGCGRCSRLGRIRDVSGESLTQVGDRWTIVVVHRSTTKKLPPRTAFSPGGGERNESWSSQICSRERDVSPREGKDESSPRTFRQFHVSVWRQAGRRLGR